MNIGTGRRGNLLLLCVIYELRCRYCPMLLLLLLVLRAKVDGAYAEGRLSHEMTLSIRLT